MDVIIGKYYYVQYKDQENYIKILSFHKNSGMYEVYDLKNNLSGYVDFGKMTVYNWHFRELRDSEILGFKL
jgi:hypothetical protein